MSIISALFGRRDELEERKRQTEQELAQAKQHYRQQVQKLESGSRVMANMAGMMALVRRDDEDA